MDALDVKPDAETLTLWEQRAPGWEVRCLRCGLREPWGKYGIRKFAAGRKYTVGRCHRCGRFCCHVVTRTQAEDAPAQLQQA